MPGDQFSAARWVRNVVSLELVTVGPVADPGRLIPELHVMNFPAFAVRSLLTAALAMLGATGASRAAELTVFAAASLSVALKEIAPAYEAASGDKLRFNLAASSALARQIQEGAPADVFFSADEAKMDDLAEAGLIVPETRHSLLSNSLVHCRERRQ